MTRRATGRSGFTFVELMIALVILSIVGAVAANAILTATQVDREVRRRSRAAAACSEAARIVAADVANMVCGDVFGRKPYSESIEQESAERVVELVVAPPDAETEAAREVPTGALVVQYTVHENADHTWRLERGVARLGVDGKTGDSATGVLLDGSHQIAFDPVVEGEAGDARLKRINCNISFLFDAGDGPEVFGIIADSSLEQSRSEGRSP